MLNTQLSFENIYVIQHIANRWQEYDDINLLTPSDPYRGRTAPLTSKVASYLFNKYRY